MVEGAAPRGLNLVIIKGTLACPPEGRMFDSGSRLLRLLVTVRTNGPRRVDVIPVTMWDGEDVENFDDLASLVAGQSVSLVGSVQRRFWDGPKGRNSRIEVVAEEVSVEDAV